MSWKGKEVNGKGLRKPPGLTKVGTSRVKRNRNKRMSRSSRDSQRLKKPQIVVLSGK